MERRTNNNFDIERFYHGIILLQFLIIFLLVTIWIYLRFVKVILYVILS